MKKKKTPPSTKKHQDNLVKYLSEHVLHLTSLSTIYLAKASTHTALSEAHPGCQTTFKQWSTDTDPVLLYARQNLPVAKGVNKVSECLV